MSVKGAQVCWQGGGYVIPHLPAICSVLDKLLQLGEKHLPFSISFSFELHTSFFVADQKEEYEHGMQILENLLFTLLNTRMLTPDLAACARMESREGGDRWDRDFWRWGKVSDLVRIFI